MTNSATSHLLPVFARVDLGFERGEGAWLIATNGERYLDFTSGVAVNALGHCHPHLVAALQEQATKLCPLRVLRQFRRRGDGMRHQSDAQISFRQRPPGALPDHHLRQRVSWAD